MKGREEGEKKRRKEGERERKRERKKERKEGYLIFLEGEVCKS